MPRIAGRTSLHFTRSGTVAALIGWITVLSTGAARAQQPRTRSLEGDIRLQTTAPRLVERASFVDQTEGGEAILYRPSYFVFDPDGQAYIPDPGAHAILVFDRDLRLVRRIGREGEGPGEMKWPCAVRMAPDGSLAVQDPDNHRVSYFSTTGTFLRSERFSQGQSMTLTSNDDYIPVLDGGFLRVEWMYYQERRRTRESDRTLLEIVDREDRVIRGLGNHRTHADERIASMLSSVAITVTPSAKVVAAFEYSPEIHVYDLPSGALERTINRELEFRPTELAVTERTLRSPDGRSSQRRIEPVGDTVSLDVAVDEAGCIWVLTNRLNQKETEACEAEGRFDQLVKLEVLRPDGLLLGSWPLADPASRLAFDPSGDLWLMDRSYNMTIWRFEVIWP
jgi:hypothetical protein